MTPNPAFIPPNRPACRLLPETEQKPSLAGNKPQKKRWANVEETPEKPPWTSP
jgi:hypothetical protein